MRAESTMLLTCDDSLDRTGLRPGGGHTRRNQRSEYKHFQLQHCSSTNHGQGIQPCALALEFFLGPGRTEQDEPKRVQRLLDIDMSSLVFGVGYDGHQADF